MALLPSTYLEDYMHQLNNFMYKNGEKETITNLGESLWLSFLPLMLEARKCELIKKRGIG